MADDRPTFLNCNGCGDEIREDEYDYHGGYCAECHTDRLESARGRKGREDAARRRDAIRRRRHLR